MSPETVTNTSYEAFQKLIKNKKVIIVYPHTPHRNLFLSYFLQDEHAGFLYYRLPKAYLSLSAWLRDMVEQLKQQFDGFGAELSRLFPTVPADGAGSALAADLGAVKQPRVTLYLDELDRVPYDADFRTFARALVSDLPPHVQLVLNARALHYEPWIDMVGKQEVAILGTAHRRNDLMYTPSNELCPQIEVYAFGQGQAMVNGMSINNWDGALPRNLFFYFMDNTHVTRRQIFDVFWPELNPKEATNVFHVTKRKITERISENVLDNEDYELTSYSGGFYAPSNRVVRHYDVTDFEEALSEATASTLLADQSHLYRRAVEIYRAPFLMDMDLPWVLERRVRLRQRYVEALIGLARTYKEKRQPAEALGYFLRALREAPHREDIHREAMLMYGWLGRPEDATHQYQLLINHLNEYVGVPPSRETRTLYESIISGNL